MHETRDSRPLGPVHWILDLDAGPEPDRRESVLAELLDAGLSSLQLRGPGYATPELVRAGRPLRLAAHGRARFIVNRDADAAVALDADGLHLPSADLDVAAARKRLPRGFLVGASCHSAAEVRRARGADWVFVSPVFATESKPGIVPIGPRGLRDLVAETESPVYALGGVTRHNTMECLAAGAAGVAAIRGLSPPDGTEWLASR